MKISIIGSTGLVGSRITELLKNEYQIEELNSSNGFDITNQNSVEKLKNSDSTLVVHLAAKSNVDGCEDDKPLGQDGDAWKINVDGTKHVAKACSTSNKRLIYISTDFVFDGKKKQGEKYSEQDTPNPINWYAQTKHQGELVVQKTCKDFAIVRIAYPYSAHNKTKPDFANILKNLLKEGKTISAVTDHIFCPTFIDDIAQALSAVIQKQTSDIIHVSGQQALTPYKAALQIADTFGFDKSLINKTTRDEFFKDRASRPFNLALNNDKITSLGVKMSTFEQGLKKIKEQTR